MSRLEPLTPYQELQVRKLLQYQEAADFEPLPYSWRARKDAARKMRFFVAAGVAIVLCFVTLYFMGGQR
jgi:hypothetical protein